MAGCAPPLEKVVLENPLLAADVTGMSDEEIVGTEVDVSFLFADVRGSSELARRLGDRDFTRVMQRFYETATAGLFDHDALLDKIVGDEVVGFFLPFMAGPNHARGRWKRPGRWPASATGQSRAPLRLGAGVHTGPSFVGFVPRGLDSEFTALGTRSTSPRTSPRRRRPEIRVRKRSGRRSRPPVSSAATSR